MDELYIVSFKNEFGFGVIVVAKSDTPIHAMEKVQAKYLARDLNIVPAQYPHLFEEWMKNDSSGVKEL